MDQVVSLELTRFFFGDAPPLICLEILVRIAIIWLWTIVLLRWIGERSISQLSLVEFLLVIALGSAVGDAMFYPDAPLLQAMLMILVLVHQPEPERSSNCSPALWQPQLCRSEPGIGACDNVNGQNRNARLWS